MQFISKDNRKELPDLLRHLPTHDAVLKQMEYSKAEKKLWVTAQNAHEKAEITMEFGGICLLLSMDMHTQGNIWHTLYDNDPTIACFVSKNYDPIIEQLLRPYKQSIDDMLYFLFDFLSEGKIHILCETFSVDVRKIE